MIRPKLFQRIIKRLNSISDHFWPKRFLAKQLFENFLLLFASLLVGVNRLLFFNV